MFSNLHKQFTEIRVDAGSDSSSHVYERDLPGLVRQCHHHSHLFEVGILEHDLVQEVAGLGVVDEQSVL